MRLTRPEGTPSEDWTLSRRMLGGLIFAGYATAGLAQSAEPVVTDEAGLVTETVTYPAPDDFDLPAYVARPAGEGPYPVVIVASEIFGLHAYIQDVCRRLAKAGYAAVAPAFFVRAGDPAPLSDMEAVMAIVRQAPAAQVMGDVSATLAWIDQQIWADAGRVGITGFCWGGKVVWQAAARFAAIRAGVAWYGRLAPADEAARTGPEAPWPVDVAADLKGPVLGLYAENDRGIPLGTVETMRAALARAGSASEIVVYPGAAHGFHADYRAGYDAAAAADGWVRLLAHFERTVRR